MFIKILNILMTMLIVINPIPVYARCAVCYTNGLSGASIAVIVIVTFFVALFFVNKILKKILANSN